MRVALDTRCRLPIRTLTLAHHANEARTIEVAEWRHTHRHGAIVVPTLCDGYARDARLIPTIKTCAVEADACDARAPIPTKSARCAACETKRRPITVHGTHAEFLLPSKNLSHRRMKTQREHSACPAQFIRNTRLKRKMLICVLTQHHAAERDLARSIDRFDHERAMCAIVARRHIDFTRESPRCTTDPFAVEFRTLTLPRLFDARARQHRVNRCGGIRWNLDDCIGDQR